MIEFAEAAMALTGILATQGIAEVRLPCRVDVLDIEGIRSIDAAAWNALASGALEDNPWLTPQMVLSGIDAYAGQFQALALYKRDTAELIGFLPVLVKGLGSFGLGAPALNLYQVSGTPLISAQHAELAIAGLFGAIATMRGLPQHWIFPHVGAQGPFQELARAEAERLGFETGMASLYERPILTRRAQDFAVHVETVIGKKRSKDIERNWRRLEREGELRFERVDDPDTVAARVEGFLRIEASGWKGKRRTAFLSVPRDAAFARAAYGGSRNGVGLASVDSLLFDGKPIALSINIAAGKTLFTPKCAFDETYRRFGPGMLLEYKVIERFFADETFERMDAATTVDGHVVCGLWGETRTMGTLVMGPKGASTRGLLASIQAMARGKQMIKRLLKRD
ncbi:GNAT family N-acetyltransferase [Pelagibacterium sp. 26DY04]|uniref:GNAT family N-acetyltransferase n=1 Tax=Pelagibacterium sp. 26DY04 TaxID=2967130 RepID=UPI0028161CB8|nr:GNAT family N-acetyltransferase [Pelagibacterium sp. 26DY04]WMT86190.1 GNAT family N-acetyltransferase [Pelagibacterium sp. 26DY04]